MPSLDVSELNTVLGVFGAFIILYGIISVKIKSAWFLGEALPAVAIGVILGPIAAKFIDSERWGSAASGQTSDITLGVARVMIGVQLVIAGYQLPAKYCWHKIVPLLICLLPIMTIMWLFTTLCVLTTIPNLTLLACLVIGSCVTCTDPILSQAIAKGPFADKFVARDLREIISSEAGANDGFGFPFLMLAVYLIRHADIPGLKSSHGAGVNVEEGPAFGGAAGVIPLSTTGAGSGLVGRAEEAHATVGRLGGGVGVAMGNWFLETWLYVVLMSMVIGALVGFVAGKALKFALRKKWVDSESYLLYPTALGLWLVGICGMLGTDDLLACFVAGNALNWDGEYLRETEARHDEVNSVVDVLLNFGGFMYIGSVIPWSEFHQPDTTGITIPRLIGLGFMVLLLRRIPAILMTYKFMPSVCKNYKEALFMGYFGPIGAGAVFYVEHTRHLFPELGEGDAEETNLVRAMIPVVYWLVLFSIVVHGLSIPALNLIYTWYGVKPIQEDAVSIRRLSVRIPTPVNAAVEGEGEHFVAFNRFSRPVFQDAELPVAENLGRRRSYYFGPAGPEAGALEEARQRGMAQAAGTGIRMNHSAESLNWVDVEKARAQQEQQQQQQPQYPRSAPPSRRGPSPGRRSIQFARGV